MSENLTVSFPGGLLSILSLPPSECGVIHQRQDFLDIIGTECAKLPHFVKLFVTSRMEPDIVNSFKHLQPFKELDATEENNKRDIRVFAQDILKRWSDHPDISAVVDDLVKKSGGLFIWLVLARSRISVIEEDELSKCIAEIPDNMDILYARSVEAAYADEPHLSLIMSIVIAAFEPLLPSTIAALLQIPKDVVAHALDRIAAVIGSGEKVQVVHKSFRGKSHE